MLKLQVHALGRRYGFRKVFSDLEFSAEAPQAVVICGPNGSGKSTLLKILTYLDLPTAGQVVYSSESRKPMKKELVRSSIAFVSPEFNLYEELSALENLKFYLKVSGRGFESGECLECLDRVGLIKRSDDFISEYSFGMKMRLKYALALAVKPEVLAVDEPSTNLDRNGREIAYSIMREFKRKGLLLFATNEDHETEMGDVRVELGR